jgi:hypothetical protein
MALFRRNQQVPPPPPVVPELEDTPAALRDRLAKLVVFVNQSAGRLPVEAVVGAHRVTDVVREILDDAAADAVPDVHVIIAVRGMVDDYLPTTLHAYLALDAEIAARANAQGSTPAQHLVEQLDGLWLAGLDVLRAAQSRDVDNLLTQGNFLRTKFSGSDLDL